MKHFKIESPKDDSVANHEREFLITKEWSEFILRRRIVNCLLCLLGLRTVFALVVVAALIATGQTGRTGVVISVLLAGTVGFGKLLNNVFSSIFRSKE